VWERTSSKDEDKAKMSLARTTWTTKSEISKSMLCLTVTDVLDSLNVRGVVDSLKVINGVDEGWISNREEAWRVLSFSIPSGRPVAYRLVDEEWARGRRKKAQEAA
jgi:hypothetical protein